MVGMAKAGLGLGFLLALAACGSGVDAAMAEMTSSCVNSANGQLSEAECSCMTEKSFAVLSPEEQDLMGAISSSAEGLSDAELAEELGLSSNEMRSQVNRVRSKIMDTSIASAMECMGS